MFHEDFYTFVLLVLPGQQHRPQSSSADTVTFLTPPPLSTHLHLFRPYLWWQCRGRLDPVISTNREQEEKSENFTGKTFTERQSKAKSETI